MGAQKTLEKHNPREERTPDVPYHRNTMVWFGFLDLVASFWLMDVCFAFNILELY